jgi:hypothetical protein
VLRCAAVLLCPAVLLVASAALTSLFLLFLTLLLLPGAPPVRHKKRLCLATLRDMGFDGDVAAAAAEAAGCEPSAAASLLTGGRAGDGPAAGASVIRWGEDLG